MFFQRTYHSVLFLAIVLLPPWLGVGAGDPPDKEKTRATSKSMAEDAKLLDINQIDCWIQNDGTVGENPQTGGDGFYFPAGQRTISMIYTSGFWLVGKVGENIRAAVSYFESSFQPGMILPDGKPDSTDMGRYIVYKYEKGETIGPEALRQGCPEKVMGDQMLFSVCNDLTDPDYFYWEGDPIGIELQATAFAFDVPGAVGNTIFLKWHFVNKGSEPVDSAYAAMFFDPDLGFGNDDYTGCDTALGLIFFYNGDEYDEKYGYEIPALGCDILQGPVADAPGDTARFPDGTVLADKRILGMTAYFHQFKNIALPGLGDINKPEQAFHYVQGLKHNGEPWIDPYTGQATHFPFAGDPVTGTGWLISSMTTPKDLRMAASSGPFTLGVGESQDFILALIAGQGGDYLASLLVLREYDPVVKEVYRNNFGVGRPPETPRVSAAQLDREILLTWDDTGIRDCGAGYSFEGFNVYQGESEEGPWTWMMTFDIVNGVKAIFDRYYDEDIEGWVEKVVQHGSDSGLSYSFHVTRDGLHDKALVNGRPYYFAVTSYSYKPEGRPRTLENPKVAVTAIPQKPALDIHYQSGFGDIIPASRVSGTGEVTVTPVVMDPASVIAADYRVTFDIDSTWDLWRGNSVILSDQANSLMDNAYLVTDGIQVKVGGFTFDDPMDFKSVYFTQPNFAWGDEFITSLGKLGKASSGRAVDSWGFGTADLGLLQGDLELRFTGVWDQPVTLFGERVVTICAGTGSIATFVGARHYNLAEHPLNEACTEDFFPIRIPFEVWDTERDMQVNLLVYDACQTLGSGSDFYSFNPHDTMICWVNALPYRETALDADNTESDDGDYNTWNLVFKKVKHWHDSAYDQMFLEYANPVIPGEDAMAFSTRGYEPVRSRKTAESRMNEINVFPNPYFGQNRMESSLFEQFVTFTNLPEDDCVIRIFSLSGQLVRTLVHDNGTPFERWNLENEDGRVIGSGMFLIHVRTAYGDRILKFGFVNRETVYEHL